jgi:hypothetical protein
MSYALPFLFLLQAPSCDSAKLFASDASVGAHFGEALAADGFRLLVGSPGKHETAYVYERDSSGWRETARLEADGYLHDNDLGRAVGLSGDAAILGGPHYDTPLEGDDCDGGVVMIYEASANAWHEVFVHHGECDDQLGTSVAIDGALAAAGSPYRYRVLVFERGTTGWSVTAELTPPDGFPPGFGEAVDVEGDRIAVGAPGDASSPGCVYVFARSGSGWAFEQKLEASDGRAGDELGKAVVLEAGWLLAGMPGRDATANPLFEHGEVRVWSRGSGTWQSEGALETPVLPSGARFGSAIAGQGPYCVVGAPGAQRAFLYDRRGSSWIGMQGLASWSDSQSFATSVALAGSEVCFIGDPTDGSKASEAGVVYEFSGTLLAEAFCTCDSAAPCGNDSPGTGCTNSSGAGASLRACGTSSVMADDLVLLATGLPPDSTALLCMSRGSTAAGQPFGDGVLCIGAPGARLYRFPVHDSGAAGSFDEGPGLVAFTHAHFANDGQITAGDTWYFQCLFRDASGPCGKGFNSSNGLAVSFLP